MIESSFTLYKLIILYMLQNVNFPLSNTQISDFILEKEYTNYFHLQEALSELQDTKLIEIEKVRNTSYYHMTEEGSKTLSFFENEISPEIREEIDRYMKEHSYELRKKRPLWPITTRPREMTTRSAVRQESGRRLFLRLS